MKVTNDILLIKSKGLFSLNFKVYSQLHFTWPVSNFCLLVTVSSTRQFPHLTSRTLCSLFSASFFLSPDVCVNISVSVFLISPCHNQLLLFFWLISLSSKCGSAPGSTPLVISFSIMILNTSAELPNFYLQPGLLFCRSYWVVKMSTSAHRYLIGNYSVMNLKLRYLYTTPTKPCFSSSFR